MQNLVHDEKNIPNKPHNPAFFMQHVQGITGRTAQGRGNQSTIINQVRR